MVSTILVPTDTSETAHKAVEYAIELAGQTGADLILLNVIDKNFIISQSMPSVATPTHLIEPIDDYLREVAQTYIDEIEKICNDKGVLLKSAIRSGHPVEEILKEAESSNADLIVMGSHGRSAVGAAILGSVTLGVIHKESKTPVLVVKK